MERERTERERTERERTEREEQYPVAWCAVSM